MTPPHAPQPDPIESHASAHDLPGDAPEDPQTGDPDPAPEGDPRVRLRDEPPIAIIELTSPTRRNALDLRTLAELERLLDLIARRRDIRVIVLRGLGPAFCAGFDLARVVNTPSEMTGLIGGLSRILKRLRQRDQVVVAAVHGAALAGGCAIVGACDIAIVAPDASLGYPVHRIGVSPAVSSPTVAAGAGGSARSILLGGELVDGPTAVRLGLATHLGRSAELVMDDAMQLAQRLVGKGPEALRATKLWLNEIDGTAQEAIFDEAAAASAGLAANDESIRLLEAFWSRRAR